MPPKKPESNTKKHDFVPVQTPSPPVKTSVPEKVINAKKAGDLEAKSPKADEFKSALQSLKKRNQKLKLKLESDTNDVIIEGHLLLVDEVNKLLSDIDLTQKQLKSTLEEPKFKMTSQQVVSQLKDLSQAKENTEAAQAMAYELRDELNKVLAKEAFAHFVQEASKLKIALNEKVETSSKLVDFARKRRNDDELRSALAAVRGVELSALDRRIPIRSEDVYAMPSQVKELLFHPAWLSRKLENEFGVVVDKPKNQHTRGDGCSISGFPDDVKACQKKLQSLDFSGKKSIVLDGRAIASVLGPGGSNAHEIEKDCDVIIVSMGTEITIYGVEDCVKKAIDAIGKIVSLKGAISDHAQQQISRSVDCSLYVARALINDVNGDHAKIEKKCGVVLSVVPKTDDQGMIMIKGSLEGVSRALPEVEDFISHQIVKLIVVEDEAEAAWLFDGSQKKGMGEVKLMVRFNNFKREQGVTISRGNGNSCHIGVIVSDKNETRGDEIVREIKLEILPKTRWSTQIVPISRDHNRCWNEPACKLVSEKSGADVTFRRFEEKDKQSVLEVFGSEDARQEALKLIEEFHTPRILNVPPECAKPLISDRCRVITEIQSDAVVHLAYAKNDKKIFMYGIDESKDHGERLFQDFVNQTFASMAHLTVKSFDLLWEEIGSMIGPKGRTINRIREESGCDDIRIDETAEGSKVIFTGTSNAVEIAIQMAEEELSARKEVTVIQNAVGNILGTGEAIEKTAGSKGALLGQGKSQGSSWAQGPQTTEVKPEEINVENEEMFPTLGAPAGGGKKKKLGKKN